MDPKVTQFLEKYIKSAENRHKFLQSSESIEPILNAEEELNRINANNANGLQQVMNLLEKNKKWTEKWISNATAIKSCIQTEIEESQWTANNMLFSNQPKQSLEQMIQHWTGENKERVEILSWVDAFILFIDEKRIICVNNLRTIKWYALEEKSIDPDIRQVVRSHSSQTVSTGGQRGGQRQRGLWKQFKHLFDRQ